MTMSFLRLLGVTAAAAGLVVLPATNASAATEFISINTGSGWTHDSVTPLFTVDKLAPGDSRTASLQVRNDSSDSAALSLSSADLVEFENGCMHSEAVIDTTCGATQGELGHQLVFGVYLDPENDGSYEATPAWTGTLYDLASPATLL